MQVEAAPLQGLRELACVVRRQVDERDSCRAHRAQLRYGHLVLGQHLEKQGLRLELQPVNLVYEKDDTVLRANCFEQGPREEEFLGEYVLFECPPSRLSFRSSLSEPVR